VKTIHHVLDISTGPPAVWATLTAGAGLKAWWSRQVSVNETGTGTQHRFHLLPFPSRRLPTLAATLVGRRSW